MASSKLKSILKKTFFGLVIVFIVIQFIRPEKNLDNANPDKDITRMYPVPDSVLHILQKACFDCHSDATRYPWYFSIQPVAWWMDSHIKDAKDELNFSEFGTRPLPKQAKKLKKIVKAIDEGWMPLDSYTWMHKDAILTDGEKKLVIDWANNLSQQITAQLPAAK